MDSLRLYVSISDGETVLSWYCERCSRDDEPTGYVHRNYALGDEELLLVTRVIVRAHITPPSSSHADEETTQFIEAMLG